jgi:hypothetical protein
MSMIFTTDGYVNLDTFPVINYEDRKGRHGFSLKLPNLPKDSMRFHWYEYVFVPMGTKSYETIRLYINQKLPKVPEVKEIDESSQEELTVDISETSSSTLQKDRK